MPERISTVAHEYAGRQVKVGERFDVEPAHVELMLGLGRIEREEGDAVPAHVLNAATWGAYATREMTAESAAPRKRSYQRKAA